MRKSIRKIVLDLPGPMSYCSCITPCSKPTVDHLIPKSLLKHQLGKVGYKKANTDLHNLHRCCERMNRSKSNLLFGENYQLDSYFDYLARNALYMEWKYSLTINNNVKELWNTMALASEPEDFEHERNQIIIENGGNHNIFLSHHIDSDELYNISKKQ